MSAAGQAPPGLALDEFRCMGTSVHVLVEEHKAASAFRAVRRLFETWHTTLTRFDPASELSRLNAAGGGWTVVSPLLFEVTSHALAAAQRTEGVFDPCLLGQILAAGYDRTFAEVPSDSTAAPPPGPGGAWREVELDASTRSVRLSGAGLDLGGIAKGMAVDAALTVLAAMGFRSAAVEAGGDLAVLGLPPGLAAWPTAVDAGDGGAQPVVDLRRGALATSTVLRRRWRRSGAVSHHLIDPGTGLPSASVVVAATVAAPTCELAEVAAKVALLVGPTEGLASLKSLGYEGRLVLADHREVTTPAWPRETTKLA